ncbi:MAG: hypothetical protein V1720_12590 [bacterium]
MRQKITILSIVVLLFAYSCDILTTRDSEPPDQPRSNFLPATTPEILFQNFQNSIREKNEPNYMASFVDSSFLNKIYKFVPSSGSISQYSILAYWDLTAEKQYFNHIIASAGDFPISVTLVETEKSITGDSASFQFDYELSLPFTDESIPSKYEGTLLFKIQLDTQQKWVIYEWEDYKKEALPSWSELKGRFYL